MSDIAKSKSSAQAPTSADPAIRPALVSWSVLTSGPTLLLVALAAIWLWFFSALRSEWEVNPQYSYGYLMPFLGAALLWRRWPDRPDTVPGKSTLWCMAAVGLLLLQLPLNLAIEANPEWRLLYWVNGFQVIGLFCFALHRWGGARWVWHFGPALVFMLIAVPWPMEMEQWVIQGLMRFIAGLTVEVAGLLGIPALQHGNLIEVGVGVVGIDEACSGVRSLQSALMLSLFLGEMHRFFWVRRAVLIGASLLAVLLANLARTTFLVWAAANRGLHQMEAWHDTAGNLIMLIVLPSLIGLAYLIKPKQLPEASPSNPRAKMVPAMPRWVGLSALSWLLAVLVTTEIWYRYHEASLIPNVKWSVSWPSQNPQFTKTSIPEKSLAILRCSNSQAAAWQDEEGNRWSGFLLRWDPGRNSAQLAKGHRPDICFPASGARLAEDFGLVTLAVNGVTLTFRHQSFQRGQDLMHVFYCLWSDQIPGRETPALEDGSQASRLQAVLTGRRNLGQQVLEVVVEGVDNSDEAVAALKRQLPNLVKPL